MNRILSIILLCLISLSVHAKKPKWLTDISKACKKKTFKFKTNQFEKALDCLREEKD